MTFPNVRLRRLRKNEKIRELLEEVRLSPKDLICPVFVKENTIDNDSSLEVLKKVATSQAQVGVDVVSPSAMMDGQVKAIRHGLDDAGFTDVAIMSHSAKHRSNLYSPFRDMAHCAP